MSRQEAEYLKDTMLEDNEGDLTANNNKDDNEESSESPRFINIVEWWPTDSNKNLSGESAPTNSIKYYPSTNHFSYKESSINNLSKKNEVNLKATNNRKYAHKEVTELSEFISIVELSNNSPEASFTKGNYKVGMKNYTLGDDYLSSEDPSECYLNTRGNDLFDSLEDLQLLTIRNYQNYKQSSNKENYNSEIRKYSILTNDTSKSDESSKYNQKLPALFDSLEEPIVMMRALNTTKKAHSDIYKNNFQILKILKEISIPVKLAL